MSDSAEDSADESSSLMREAQGPTLVPGPTLDYPPRARANRPMPTPTPHPHPRSLLRVLHGRAKDAHYEVQPSANLILFYRNMPPRFPSHRLPDDPKELDALQEEEDHVSVLAHADLLAYRCWGCCTGGVLDIKLVYLDTKPNTSEPETEFRVLHLTPKLGVYSQPFHDWMFSPKEWHNVEIHLPHESHAALLRFIHKQHNASYNSVNHLTAALGFCCCLTSGIDHREIAPERNLYDIGGFLARDFRDRPDWSPAQLVAACLVHCGLIDAEIIDVNSITFKEIKHQVKVAFHKLAQIHTV